MTTVAFFQLDPRPVGREDNENFFAQHQKVLGIEVTQPAYKSKLVANLDHHRPGDDSETPSACMQALGYQGEIPDAMVTSRADADSVTAMAIISNSINPQGEIDKEVVVEVDRFDRLGPNYGTDSTIAIARIAGDFKMSLADRVAWVLEFLLDPASKATEVAELVKQHKADLEAAKAATEVQLHGKVALVTSSHMHATQLGYQEADILVCFNPEMPVNFKAPEKGTYKKFTVCKRDSHVPCDLVASLQELQALEEGWGGRDTIFGSPQGVSSQLTPEQVIEVVQKYTS